MGVSRRNFIVSTAAAAGATLAAQPAAVDARSTPLVIAQAGAPAPHGFDPKDPALKYDLVLANGDVLDPSQKLRGKRDLGIKHGQIAAVEANISAARAVQRIDVSGKPATPRLVHPPTHRVPHPRIRRPGGRPAGGTPRRTPASAG